MTSWAPAALLLATTAHTGVTDKAGLPYIDHPRRVAARAELLRQEHFPHLNADWVRCVALLHDVLEDTHLTRGDLAAQGFPKEVLTALDLLTHPRGEPYLEYVTRLCVDPLARVVKMADNEDNSDEERLALLPEATQRRLRRKYQQARVILHTSP